MTAATRPTAGATADLPAPWADRTGRVLLATDAVATLGAFAQGVPRIVDAADERLLTEFWRTSAYLVFAGMWALLAIAPRRQGGMWELILVRKIAVTLFVVVTTGAAYILSRGWHAWRPGALGQESSVLPLEGRRHGMSATRVPGDLICTQALSGEDEDVVAERWT